MLNYKKYIERIIISLVLMNSLMIVNAVKLTNSAHLKTEVKEKKEIVLSDAGRVHWRNAKIYIEEAQETWDYSMAINELQEMLKTDEYPEAYLELARLFSKYITSDYINKSNEYFDKYIDFCPSKRNEIEDEKEEIKTRRKIKQQKFENKLVGKWTAVLGESISSEYGDFITCFEISRNVNGKLLIKVPATYSYDYDSVMEWKYVDLLYYPQFGMYVFQEPCIYSDSFRVKVYDQTSDISPNFQYISIRITYSDDSIDKNSMTAYLAWGESGHKWFECLQQKFIRAN